MIRIQPGAMLNMCPTIIQGPSVTGIETRFVDPEFYCRLLTSRRCLERMDDHARGLRGVLDPVAHVCYVVEERKLGRPQVSKRRQSSEA